MTDSARPLRFLPPALLSLTFFATYAGLYFTAMPLFADPDVPWHIAAGNAIRALGGLPEHDSWSFTAGNQPWYNISWLWDIFLSFMDKTGGAHMVFVGMLAITALVAALLAGNLTRRRGVGSDALIFAVFFAGLAFLEFATARPQLAAYLCAVLFHRFLHDSRESNSMKTLWWLPVLMVLWVNTHGSFFVGFIIIGAYGLESLIYKQGEWFKRLLIIGLCCLAALLVNPYGIHMVNAVMRTLHSVTTKYILEWLPFVFGQSLGISAWLLFFVLACGFREPTIPMADKILSLAWFVIMMFSIRNAAFFVILSAPYMAIGLQRFVDQLDRIRTHRQDVLLALQKPGMEWKMALMAVVVVAGSIPALTMLKGNSWRVDVEKDPGPVIAWMAEHEAGKRILNDYNFGGRIIYDTHGTFPVFADGRAGTAYSEEVLTDYLAFMNQEDKWQENIEKYHIDGIMAGNTLRFATAYANGQFHDKWQQVYKDEVAGVYIRK